MTGRSVRAFIALAAALIGAGYYWGHHASSNAWKAKDRDRLQAEATAREAEIRRGEKASGALQAELLAQSLTNDQLTKAFNDYKRRNPIVIVPCSQVGAPATAPATRGAQPEVQRDEVPAGNGLSLTAGAVWMWNSALAGRNVASGACGLAGAAEGACATDSGVTVEDAWDNQALNARICAENRIRHRRLIDFINNKGAAPVQP